MESLHSRYSNQFCLLSPYPQCGSIPTMSRTVPPRMCPLRGWASVLHRPAAGAAPAMSRDRERRLKLSGICFNKPRGRDSATLLFEKRIHLVECATPDDINTAHVPGVAVVELVQPSQLSYPQPHRLAAGSDDRAATSEKPGTFACATQRPDDSLPDGALRQLLRNGDTYVHTVSSDGSNGPNRLRILVVEPDTRHKQFRREETQVELMTAYRNVLYEVAEWHTQAPSRVGAFERPRDAQRIATHTLRIPALSLQSCGTNVVGEIAKLNQQALVKGFHRCAPHVKEWYALQEQLRVEIYVPAAYMRDFVRAFGEEPWPHPESIWDPGRLTLYPGMPVPDGLLQYEGWTGKRGEILAAKNDPDRQLHLSALDDYDAIRNATTIRPDATANGAAQAETPPKQTS